MKMKTKHFLRLVAVLCVLLVLATGCSDSDVTQGNPTGEKWSVFVYLCGTDLESQKGYMASINIEEMVRATESENVQVIFQTGGTAAWGTEGIDASRIQRYRVTNGDIQLVGEEELSSMGEASTLGNYLEWGTTNYPADKYMCLLWNHGGGSVAGVCFDELYDNDSLDLNELSTALSQPGVQFEVVGFDTCLMATLETAAAVSPYARYMVASEEVEPGTGWDYTAWLSYLAENSEKTGVDVGKVICDSYLAKCAAGETDAIATLSLIDLSKIPDLVEGFESAAAELNTQIEDITVLGAFTSAYTKAENYGGNNENEGYTNMVDLGDMISRSKDILPETSSQLLSLLDSAVLYKVNGSGRSASNGLSVFAPLKVTPEELESYAPVAFSGNYLRYISAVSSWDIPQGLSVQVPVVQGSSVTRQAVPISDFSPVSVPQGTDEEVAFSTEVKDNNYYLHISNGYDAIVSVKYNLYFADDAGEEFYYLGSDFDVIEDTAGEFCSNLRNVWPIINDQLCSLIPLSFDDEYILYTVPILCNGERTNLRMTYRLSDGQYEIVGTWNGIDSSGMSDKEIRKLKDGDEIEFLFSYTDLSTNESDVFSNGGFTVSGEPVAEEAILFDGVYFYQYEITDVFGRTYQSEFVPIEIFNGEATIGTNP